MRRNGFYERSCRKNGPIGLRVGTLVEDLKRKDEIVNQPFLTNGSGFIHHKHFLKNQKFNFLNYK